jgi:hypothetical protein
MNSAAINKIKIVLLKLSSQFSYYAVVGQTKSKISKRKEIIKIGAQII